MKDKLGMPREPKEQTPELPPPKQAPEPPQDTAPEALSTADRDVRRGQDRRATLEALEHALSGLPPDARKRALAYAKKQLKHKG